MAVLSEGQLFPGYHLVSLISRGGMGEVWKARKEGPGGWSKTIALKVILPTLSDDEHLAAMFQTEARIAAQLDHPNIVPVFAFGREGELLWFEQEFVDGLDLAAVLRQTPSGLPVDVALFVATSILEALRYAYERAGPGGRPLRVVHRDIKPHNVLVSREGHVKLADFGIAKVAAYTGAEPSNSALKGTSGYLAPELLDGHAATHRSDLFCVGVVLWELLTGRRLFTGDTEAERIKRTYECRVPALSDVGVAVPPPVEQVLLRLLERIPRDRHESAAATLDELRELPESRAAGAHELKRLLTEHAMLSVPRDSSSSATVVARPQPKTVSESDGIPIPVDDPRGYTGYPAPAPSAVRASVEHHARRQMDAETRTALPDPSAPSQDPMPLTPTLAGQVHTTAAGAPRRRRVVAIAALTVAGITALVWLIARSEPSPATMPAAMPERLETSRRSAASPHESTDTEIATSRAAASQEPVPERVRIAISVEPDDATVTVDGQVLAPPFVFEAEIGQTLTVHAERKRYVSRDLTLTVDGPLEVPISLERRRRKKHRNSDVIAPIPSSTDPPSKTSKPAKEPKPPRGKDAIFLPTP